MADSIPIERIKERDLEGRPQLDHQATSSKLSAIYEDRATHLVINHLKTLGAGNRDIEETQLPVMTQAVGRIVDQLSASYSTPPVRRIMIDGEPVPDDKGVAAVVEMAFERSNYAEAWKSVSAMRALHKQAVVSFDEDPRDRSVAIGIYEPCSVWRHYPLLPRASLEHDEWILLQVSGSRFRSADGVNARRRAPGEYLELFWAWHQPAPGVWQVWLCDESGGLLPVEHQPYGEDGIPPFEGLPVMICHDSYTNDPWLPIPESRLSFAMSINAQLNDLEYLVLQEAHSRFFQKTDNPNSNPVTNPGAVLSVAADEDVGVLSSGAKIEASIAAMESTSQALAVSESIPVESIVRKPGGMTGDAIVASERDMDDRRMKKGPIAGRCERMGFEKFKTVYNAFAEQWGQIPIPSRARLSFSLGRAVRAKTPDQKQSMLLKEMAAGMLSPVGYLMSMHGVTRREAIDLYSQIQAEREQYPLEMAQPAGSLVDDAGPRVALGEGSATRVKGIFHPNLAGASEGGSVVSTAIKTAGGLDS